MATHSDLRQDGSIFRYDATILSPMEQRVFDVSWLIAEGHHQGNASGRGEAHFFRFAGRELVLRHFRRGGLLGRVNRDLYLMTQLEQTRSISEFKLLSWMRDQGLPVPRPVAARVTPAGLLYRAAIVTERIADARPVEEVLRDAPLSAEAWGRVGRVVRQLHDAGVDHSDLNCRNILIDGAQRVWLIDFDKCRRRTPGHWTVENLERLKRSLRKQGNIGPGLHWSEDDWHDFQAGYDGAKSDGADPPR